MGDWRPRQKLLTSLEVPEKYLQTHQNVSSTNIVWRITRKNNPGISDLKHKLCNTSCSTCITNITLASYSLYRPSFDHSTVPTLDRMSRFNDVWLTCMLGECFRGKEETHMSDWVGLRHSGKWDVIIICVKSDCYDSNKLHSFSREFN